MGVPYYNSVLYSDILISGILFGDIYVKIDIYGTMFLYYFDPDHNHAVILWYSDPIGEMKLSNYGIGFLTQHGMKYIQTRL